jgi:photosystem II stability/assembly factor-like uncharacterized protein
MKLMIRILCCSFLIAMCSCNKQIDSPPPNPPSPPVDQRDSLLGDWQTIATGLKDITDVWFRNAREGYVATPDGVYSSLDSGKTWIPTNAKGAFNNLFFLNSNVGYAEGTTDFAYTIDGGMNWIMKSLPFTADVQPRNCYFTTPSTGFITARFGTYKTTDTGNTWTTKLTHGSNAIYFKNPSVGWLEYGSLYKTIDSGNTWKEISGVFTSADFTNNTLQFTDDAHAWLTSHVFIGRSNDTGKTWTKIDFPDRSNFPDLQFFNSERGYISSDTAIYKTVNGGTTWTRECLVKNAKLVEIFFLDEHTGWACGSDGTFLRLKN